MIAALRKAIAAHFADRRVPAQVVVGRHHRPMHEAGYRVILIPTAFAYVPPKNGIGGNPRPIATEQRTIEIVVHARAEDAQLPELQEEADLEACDALAAATVAALHLAMPRPAVGFTVGELDLGSGSYGDLPELSYGTLKVFSVVVDVPVLDQTWPTVDDATADASHKLSYPSGDQTVIPQE